MDQTVDEELVYLSPFEVSSDRVTAYRVADSAASRVRRDLIDTPATINVISSEFVNEIGAASVQDATQYVSGMSTPVLGGVNGTQERQTVRGFDIFGATIDNFTGITGSFSANIEPQIMERIEIFKGPNAILSPNSPPGGAANLMTKSPKFNSDHVISLELADQHHGSRLSLDSTGRVPGTEHFAYRLITTYRGASDIVPGRVLNKTFNPMLTWAPSEKTQIKLKGFLFNWGRKGATASNSNNLRLRRDIAQGKVISFDDIEPGYAIGEANGHADWQVNDNKIRRVQIELLTTLGDNLDLRVAALSHHSHTHNTTGGLWVSRFDGSRNPYTGEFDHYNTWALQDGSNKPEDYHPVTNPYVSTSVPWVDSSKAAELRQEQVHDWTQEVHLQVDLAGKWDFGNSRGSPLATVHGVTGVSRSRGSSHGKGFRVTPDLLPGYDFTRPFLDNPPAPTGLAGPDSQWGDWGDLRNVKTQYYGHVQVDVLGGRLQLSGGLARQDRNFREGFNRPLPSRPGSTYGGQQGSRNNPNYSVLYKITPRISAYASHADNSDVVGVNSTTGQVSMWSEGEQDEVGIKFELFDRRLLFTSAYYELKKTNIATADPLRYLDPTLPDSLADITNKGFEVDIIGQITSDLTVMASYTDMEMRDQVGRRRANVPDKMYTGLIRYKISSGSAKGLSGYLGFVYRGESPGENPFPDRTQLGVVIAPSFYMPSYTVYNFGASYSFGVLSFQLNIENVFDKKVLAGSGGRHAIGWLPERNIRLTTSYSF